MEKRTVWGITAVAIALATIYWIIQSTDRESVGHAQPNPLRPSGAEVVPDPPLTAAASVKDSPQTPATTIVSAQDSRVAAPLPYGAPLATIYPELYQRAKDGDQKAACRLVKEIESCKRYAQFVAGGGKLGPYDRVNDPSALDALDQKMFGMPMEAAAVVCSGFDTRQASHEQAPVMRTARKMTDSPVSVQAAIYLHISEGYDPENVKVLAARAAVGDLEAVNFLGTENLLEESVYGKPNGSLRNEELLRWLTVLQFITKDERWKLDMQAQMARLETDLPADRYQRIKQEAMEIAQSKFTENSFLKTHERGPYSIEDLCNDR